MVALQPPQLVGAGAQQVGAGAQQVGAGSQQLDLVAQPRERFLPNKPA